MMEKEKRFSIKDMSLDNLLVMQMRMTHLYSQRETKTTRRQLVRYVVEIARRCGQTMSKEQAEGIIRDF